jgi:Fe-S-cluster containining protein
VKIETASVPECLRCGACCFGAGERYVPVSGDDHARLGDAAEAVTQFIGNRCYMRMLDEHCAALTLTLDGRFICGVYAQRPDVCRELARAGGACQAELGAKHTQSHGAMLRVLAG